MRDQDRGGESGSMGSAELDQCLDQLCELPSSERAAYLDQYVSSDEAQAQLLRLLAHFDEASEGKPVPGLGGGAPGLSEGASTAESTIGLPAEIGGYRIVREIGSGGMGVVYLAEQERPRRNVAIKVLRGSVHAQRQARRFELEAELLGRLQHHGIAQVFESGTAGEGAHTQAYLAMEYIDGLEFFEYAQAKGLDLRQRVRLLIDVAEAVHHAHLRGIVHRDLKPNNILVTAEGQVKVIDFGVARALDREADATQQTRTGDIVGTLAYMSPEQVRGDINAIDTRADVYALGVLAYRLLSGQAPLDLKDKTLASAARVVCEIDPPRLSSVAPECGGDLEWITARALEKEASQRYQSAGAFAADLERHLKHEAIEARPATAIYQLRKIARRHRAVVTGILTALLAIVIGAGVAVHYGIRNKDLAAAERKAAGQAEISAREAESMAQLASERAGEAERRAQELQSTAEYQSSVLNEIDPRLMGEGLLDGLRKSFERSLLRESTEPQELAIQLEAFEATLRKVNPTEVAARTIEHAIFDQAAQALEDQFEKDSKLQLILMTKLAESMGAMGVSERAVEVFERVIAACEGRPGLNESLLEAQAGLARELIDFGRIPEALSWAEKAQVTCLKVHEPGSRAHRNGLVLLGTAYKQSDDYERGEAIFREALGASEDQDEVRASAQGALGSLLADLGRLDEAEQLHREAHQGLQEIYGAEHGRVINMLQQVGSDLVLMKRFDEARTLLGPVLEGSRQASGDDHRATLAAQELVMRTYLEESRLAEAQPLAEEVLGGYQRIYGEVSEQFFGPLMNVTMLYFFQGDLEQARPRAEQAYSLAHKLWGSEDPRLLAPIALLGDIYKAIQEADSGAEWNQRIQELQAELRALEGS